MTERRHKGAFPVVDEQFEAAHDDGLPENRVLLFYSAEAELEHGSLTASVRNTATGQDVQVVYTAMLSPEQAEGYPRADKQFVMATTPLGIKDEKPHKEPDPDKTIRVKRTPGKPSPS